VTQPDDNPKDGILEHLHGVVIHGLGVIRCYITMLAAEAELRGRRVLDHALWVFLLVGLGVAGIAFFSFGVAQWIQSRLSVPGSGAMIVGLALILLFVVIALARALRKERG